MHGPNLFPDVPGFRETVLDYMAAVTQLGHRLMEGIALSLGLPAAYFAERYTRRPADPVPHLQLPDAAGARGLDVQWGVGEHTDYGLLTILRQDDVGGLQVHTPGGWIEAPPVPGSFVCNIGDMLDRMTGGLYKSTPHRVTRNTSGRDRLSFPLFFDPNFEARVQRIEGLAGADALRRQRRALGPRQRACLQRALRRLPARQGVEGVPAAARRGARSAPSA